MRKFLNALCVVAIVAGLSACAGNDNNNAEVSAVAEECAGHKLPIAYVDTDSLIVLYSYAQEQEQKLVDKIENDRANLNARVSKLAKRQEEFQRKVQNNAFLSQSSAEQQYNELMREQELLQQEAARIDAENLRAIFNKNNFKISTTQLGETIKQLVHLIGTIEYRNNKRKTGHYFLKFSVLPCKGN